MSSNLKLTPNIRKRKQYENLQEVVIKITRCDAPTPSISLLILPSNVLKHILTFCTFHEIAQLREVCRQLNELCKAKLNKESERICEEARLMYTRSQIKLSGNLKLNPPKCSKYRMALEATCDCLTVVLYRYRPYINNNEACFIAGKVLDLIGQQMMVIKSELPNMKTFEKLNKQTKLCAVAAVTHFLRVVVPLIETQRVKSRFGNLRDSGTYPDVRSQALSQTERVVSQALSQTERVESPALSQTERVESPALSRTARIVSPVALSQTERVVPNKPLAKMILEMTSEENSRHKKENKLKDNNEAFEEQKRLVKKQARKIRSHEKLLEYQAKKIKDLNKSILEMKTNFNKHLFEMNHRIECLEKDSKSRVELVLIE